MQKIVLLLILFSISLFAEIKNSYISQEMIDSGIKIVDIRTPGEWKEMGLIEGSIPIMFFNEKGNYDVEGFLHVLNTKIDTSKTFALICHVGSRTAIVADFLSNEMKYNVINLLGGIEYATKELKIKTVPYK
ncbi:rhodanese-like domain-containing protein [Sulfurimonas aquatica]|uniref:Rhodanese-like domain-containing protein n=1 Tax=Sulfurimonas aquatica TaxID=2672570 RepID=A0A975AZD3_9BACT|nr:rhodanese-like domain-containing protein [Sulfurimonas aquatica]QSZ41386.1 rhodanese-like domain-containing protein [Sulfurimonas aquatica]